MSTQKKALIIDIPVKLNEVKIVFSIASLSFEGDLPAAIFHMGLVVDDVADWKAKSQVIAVFHTNAGHVTLHNAAYDTDRNISTGNPTKNLSPILWIRVCRLNSVVQQLGSTAGEMQIQSPE